MLPQDNMLVNQPMMQHNIQQDNIAYIVQEIIQIKQTMGHMSQVLTEAFAGVRGDEGRQQLFKMLAVEE